MICAKTLNDTGCVGGLWKKNRLDSSCANHSEEPFGAKIVSAMASTIFKSPLHCAKIESKRFFFQRPPIQRYRMKAS